MDQSPLRKGGTGADALTESVHLAQLCERFGYARYWVAEHHASTSWTGASPEILIGQIAARTSKIRVGSGGVMLSHYSALKVAEQFRALDVFHPDRIDLGVGRAPGSDQRTAFALAHPRQPADVSSFPLQVQDLLAFLSGKMATDHPFEGISALAGPKPVTGPDVWLLGSSDFSSRLAARLGLPFAFADFFGDLEHGPLVAELYRREFQPSALLDSPRLNVTVQVMCAPTEEEARYLASSRNLNKLRQTHVERPLSATSTEGDLSSGLLPPDEAAEYLLRETELATLEQLSTNYIDGDADTVRDGIIDTATRYGTTDIGIVTNCFSFEDRARSYKLVAGAFDLPRFS